MQPRSQIRGRELLLPFLLFAAFTLWRLWPLPTVLATHLIDQGSKTPLVRADLHLLVWVLAWDSHALLTQPWSLFAANSFFPAPTSLAYSEHLLGYVPLFAPTYWLTGNPILAANMLILVLFPLRGLAMYLLARRFVAPAAATLAGFLFAFQPEALAELMKFHLIGVIGLPLALYFTERWLEAARPRDAALLSLCLFQQATSSAYLAFALAFAYGTYLPLTLVGWRNRLDARRLVGLALAAGIALLGAGLLALPYLSLQALGIVPDYDQAAKTTVGLVLSSAMTQSYLLWGGVGLVGYALAAAGFLPPLHGRLHPIVVGVALVITGLVVSAGPDPRLWDREIWTPYPLLMRWLPGFATVRAPSRFLVVAQLGFCLLAGLGVARLVRHLRPGPMWLTCLGVSALALALRTQARPLPLLHQPVGDDAPPVYLWLAEHGAGRPMLELPQPSWPEAARRMLLSTTHWLPIVDGYSGHTPQTDDYLHSIAKGLPADEALQRLADVADLGWILVHGSELPPAALGRWAGALPTGLERAGRFGSDRLFRVTRKPETDLRARLLSTTVTLEGRPRALLGASCPGELRLLQSPSQPWPRGQHIAIAVGVHNLGTEPWPAAGVIPKHLVRLRTCLERNPERGCTGRPLALPLPGDVPAAGSIVARTEIWTPRTPGRYTLVLDLAQVGGEPLASCGVRPLRIPVQVAWPRRSTDTRPRVQTAPQGKQHE